MIGTILQKRYRLDRELGQGGMGAVYQGYDLTLKRQVAIKLLSQSKEGSSGRERLINEARAVAQLNHPHIVAVYDAGIAASFGEKTPFIVMEYIAGQTLQLDQAYELAEVVAIGRQICQALDHAHSKGIVHRDLKPENIIMTGTSNQTLKLMDFGLARIQGETRLTQEGAVVGTFNYIAPELLLGQGATPQSDLYSLGIILYELSTGRPPFSGDNLVAILSQHLHSPVTPASNHNPAIPPALDILILALLQKEPAKRPSSAAAVEESLARLLTADPHTAELTGVRSFSLLDRIVRGRLVGRQAELVQLHELWRHTRHGQAHLALISGEPGAGKTRLANELLAEVQLRGIPVLRGGCYEYEAVTPYLPLVEALRDWVHRQSADALRQQFGRAESGLAAEIARLAPELVEKIGPQPENPSLPPEEARSRFFDHLARFLQTLAAKDGLVLFIDDLHWTDNGTLTLLQYLLRRLRQEKIFVLATYREVELDRTHPLAAVLVDWNRERLATRLPLGRLSAVETGEMLAVIFGQEQVELDFAAAVYQETEGNPYFIEEVVKALIEQEQVYRRDGRWFSQKITELAIPQSVKEAIGRRLERLSPECLPNLYLAAVLGKQFTWDELVAAASQGEDQFNDEQLLDHLDEASSAQLIRSLPGDKFAFTHDKIREVLYEELNPIRRRRIHLRAGQALEILYEINLQDHVQTLAYHFVEGGELERGLIYCQQAAQRAADLFSLDEAARYLDQARDCAEALGQPDTVGALDQQLGQIHLLRGAFQEATNAYERALSTTTTRQQRAAILVKIGGVLAQAGRSDDITFLQAAIDDLDPESQQLEMAEGLTHLGRYFHYKADFPQAVTYLEKAAQLALALGDPYVITSALAYLSGAWQHQVRLPESMACARQLVDFGQAQGYPPAEALGNEFLAENSNLLGRWEDALAFSAQNEAIGKKIGAQDRIGWARMSRVWSYQRMGRLSEVVEQAPPAIDLAESMGDARLVSLIRYVLAGTYVDLGELRLAEEEADRLESEARSIGQPFFIGHAAHARMAIRGQHGHWDAVSALFDRFVFRKDDQAGIAFLNAAPLAAQAEIYSGRMEQAEGMLTEYIDWTDSGGLPYFTAIGLRILGQLQSAQGHHELALESLSQSVDILAAQGSRPELGRSLHQRGRLHQAMGGTAAAEADLDRAIELFSEMGMTLEHQRTAAALNR
jgi:tetratricopeptide (TPR) repeat protein